MKRFIATFFVVFSIMLIGSVTVSATDSKGSAIRINEFDSVVYGTLDTLGETDWYVFQTTSESSYYWFYLENESVDSNYLNSYPRLQVISSRDKEIGYCESVSKIECFNAKLDVNQTYYIKIYCPYNKGTGNYNLKISRKGDVVENVKERSYRIDINQKYNFGLEGSDDIDWFSFSVSSAGNYSFIIENENFEGGGINNYPELKLYSEREKELGYCDAFAGKECSFSSELEVGNYYLKVFCPYNKGTGTYSLRVSQCANGHTPSDKWIISKEATCTETGERKQMCSVCGEIIKTEQISANGHTPTGKWEDSIEPTCTDKGEHIQRCSVCNEICKTEELDANGHSLGEWKIKKEATWISLGKKEAVCTVCGEVERANDWSKVWVLPVIVLGVIAILFGVINYIKTYKRSRY